MIVNHNDYNNAFNERNQVKDLGAYIFNFLVDGTNCSPFESEIISKKIKSKISLFVPDVILPGKMVYSAVDINEQAGKPLKDCKKNIVYLTFLDPTDDVKKSSKIMRQTKILRMADEAFTQGSLLTEEDLSNLLSSDVRTIRRDVAEMRSNSIEPPLRGFIRDIGRTITHKGMIIEKYLNGSETVDLIRETKHSLKSIERYLTAFGRIIFLYKSNVPEKDIRFITKTSLSLTQEYIKIYKKHAGDEFKMDRILELTGEMYKKKQMMGKR